MGGVVVSTVTSQQAGSGFEHVWSSLCACMEFLWAVQFVWFLYNKSILNNMQAYIKSVCV